MALRIKLFIGLVRPQKIRPPHGSATKDSTPPTLNPAESGSQADRIKEFFMRRGAAEQHGKLFLEYVATPTPMTNLACGISSGLLFLTALLKNLAKSDSIRFLTVVASILGLANALRMIGIGLHWWAI